MWERSIAPCGGCVWVRVQTLQVGHHTRKYAFRVDCRERGTPKVDRTSIVNGVPMPWEALEHGSLDGRIEGVTTVNDAKRKVAAWCDARRKELASES